MLSRKRMLVLAYRFDHMRKNRCLRKNHGDSSALSHYNFSYSTGSSSTATTGRSTRLLRN